jgi:hypothetical protein
MAIRKLFPVRAKFIRGKNTQFDLKNIKKIQFSYKKSGNKIFLAGRPAEGVRADADNKIKDPCTLI